MTIPPDYQVVDTSGRTMMPGMIELHAHLILLGHGNYGEWFPWIAKQGPTMLTSVMEIAAKQLLNAGITSAVDLGAPLKESLDVRDRIAKGDDPRSAHVDERALDHAAGRRHDRPVRRHRRDQHRPRRPRKWRSWRRPAWT